MFLGLGLPITRAGGGPFYADATVALDFANNRYRNGLNAPVYADPSLVSGWSFSRTGVEYEATSSGLLVPFASGTPAITDLGLQVWEARTNSLKSSQDFTAADWAATKVSVTAAATTAPDGTLTGQKIAENTTTSGAHQVVQSITFTAAAWTFSVYVKPAERTWVFLQQDTVPSGSYFNLSGAGSLGSTTGTAPTARSITAVGNGWYRISMTFTATAVGAGLYIMPATADLTNSYVGTVNSGVYAWGAQAEVGSFAGPYIATTSASATRGAASASVGGVSVSGDFTLFAQGTVPTAPTGTFPRIASLGADASNRVELYLNGGASPAPAASVAVGGSTSFSTTPVSLTPGAVLKTAMARTGNVYTFYFNGQAAGTATVAGMPALTSLLVGVAFGSGSYFDSTIQREIIYPTGFSAAQLASLTT